MTRVITMLCPCLATLGLLAALSSGASAHEFTVSKTGKMSGKNANNMTFKTVAGEITCKSVTVGGEAGGLITEVLDLPLKWSECTAFGFISVTANVVPWDVNANETVTIAEAMIFETVGCKVTLIAQGPLANVSFVNEASGELKMKFSLTKVMSRGEGTCASELESEGTFTGAFLDKVEGGTLTWK